MSTESLLSNVTQKVIIQFLSKKMINKNCVKESAFFVRCNEGVLIL